MAHLAIWTPSLMLILTNFKWEFKLWLKIFRYRQFLVLVSFTWTSCFVSNLVNIISVKLYYKLCYKLFNWYISPLLIFNPWVLTYPKVSWLIKFVVWYFCFSLTPRAGDNALIRINGGVNALIRVYGGENALLRVYGGVNALLQVYGFIRENVQLRGFIRENVLLRIGWTRHLISPGLQVIIHGELVLSHPAIIFIHNYSFLFTILVINKHDNLKTLE